MRVLTLVAVAVLVVNFAAGRVEAHCQIPCGIYDDARQFDVIEEHARTIEKSMAKIVELSAASTPDYHMIARWTFNKEKHAQEVQDIANAYFLTQRVKVADPADEKAYAAYVKQTTLLHQMLVAAMKCKQTIDLANVELLRKVAQQYKDHYFEQHGHKP